MGHGIGSVVGKGEKSLFNSEGFVNLLCLSMEGEHGFSHGIVLHFDIRPLDAISKSPSDGFEERLFCRKSNGKTFRRAGPALTPGDLFLCKDPTQKKISPAGHQTLDPINVHNVNTRSDDHLQIAGFKDSRVQGVVPEFA
jgi:hypothetical protein